MITRLIKLKVLFIKSMIENMRLSQACYTMYILRMLKAIYALQNVTRDIVCASHFISSLSSS